LEDRGFGQGAKEDGFFPEAHEVESILDGRRGEMGD